MLSDTALLSLATDFQSVNGLDIAQARRIIFLKKLHPNPSFLTHEQAIEMLHGENRRILQQQQQQQQMMMNGGGYGGQPAGAPPPYNDPYGQQQYPPQQQYNQQPYPQQQYPPQQQYNQSNQPYPSQPGNSCGGDALRRAQYEADRAKLRLEQERMERQLDRRERQVSASERAFRVSLSISLSGQLTSSLFCFSAGEEAREDGAQEGCDVAEGENGARGPRPEDVQGGGAHGSAD